jgi:hypothetical protein
MDKIKKTYKNRYYKLTGRKNNHWTVITHHAVRPNTNHFLLCDYSRRNGPRPRPRIQTH